MRAWEFLSEAIVNKLDTVDKGKLDLIHDGLAVAAHSLPDTYTIPDLQNNDFYDLYRFGLAIAAVRGEDGQDDKVQYHLKPHFDAESMWGEQQIVSSTEPGIIELIDKALAKVGLTKKVQVSAGKSDEFPDTMHISPVKPFKGYPK